MGCGKTDDIPHSGIIDQKVAESTANLYTETIVHGSGQLYTK
jgi:hypothetical protein